MSQQFCSTTRTPAITIIRPSVIRVSPSLQIIYHLQSSLMIAADSRWLSANQLLSEIKVARWLLNPLTLKIFPLSKRYHTVSHVKYMWYGVVSRMFQREVITVVIHIFVLQASSEESSLYERETVAERKAINENKAPIPRCLWIAHSSDMSLPSYAMYALPSCHHGYKYHLSH